ncbi:pancreatic lipase-related protein 3 [Stomoxys calcitrans]|uniref:pancreatic lipase-related protein 3 n=1 Tax=Stomoxys calcitrans TaxID=35570 RepID=UPI0027E2C6B3|nr:pancreatic lipase-related protein 3 [Stomoxys calcitrans]
MRFTLGVLSVVILLLTVTESRANVAMGKELAKDQHVRDSVKFYVYTRQNRDVPQSLEANVESVVRNVIDTTKPTTLFIPHMQSDFGSDECNVIKDAKLQLEDGNVIVVDYSESITNSGDFESIVSLMPHIAEAIGELVMLLKHNFDFSLEHLHVVGFSLGGHISGITAQYLHQSLGERIPRITALDPAGIYFTANTPSDQRLSSDDAEFVEVVHTNAGQQGFLSTCGHVDYYPNGGTLQPGCDEKDMACSHERAYQLIPEMWLPLENHELLILKCPSLDYLGMDYCRWLSNKMGDLQQRPKDGVYYVETNSVKPYGKGAFLVEFF